MEYDYESRKAQRYSEEWLPEAMIDALVTERDTEPEELSDEEFARKILTRAAPKAAKSVTWLALYSSNEQVRLRASQYIVDGVIGGTFKAAGGEDDLLMAFVAQLDEETAIRVARESLR